jgi:hypothetical protein
MSHTTIDYTQTPEQILTAIINASRGSNLVASQLVFGVPAVNVGTRNTKITVAAAGGSGLAGSVTVSYDRRDIVAVPGDRIRTFTPNGASLVSELLPLINEAWEINLTAHDIVDGPLPVFSGDAPAETKPFTLQIDSDCKIYLGSVELQVRRQDILLSSIIDVTDLGDIVYP